MIIYALIYCSTALHYNPDCGPTYPPTTFRSLQECRETVEELLQKPFDKDGRIVVSPGNAVGQHKLWWQCASKRVETWQLE